jgi:methionine-rich copper-binding protein CopC
LRTGWLAGLLLAPLAWAHTTIQASIPATDATLVASPPVIEVKFEHMAQLTSVVVVAEGAEPRKLAFDPVASALRFRLLDPQLAPGRNEIRWKGLSSGDGHVIEGTLVFTVESAGARRD